MSDCVVDYCPRPSTKTLTIETADESFTLQFCTFCSEALHAQLERQKGGSVDLDLYNAPIGELQRALDYLDGPEYVPEARRAV